MPRTRRLLRYLAAVDKTEGSGTTADVPYKAPPAGEYERDAELSSEPCELRLEEESAFIAFMLVLLLVVRGSLP